MSAGNTQVLDKLRELDNETFLAVGYATFRNKRIAVEKGNARSLNYTAL